MMRQSLIITGGDYAPLPEELKKNIDAYYVIACDSGYHHAEKMGLTPALIVGDFDSAVRPDTDVPIRQYPTRKDDTDTMLAAKCAIEEGCRDITIACALGGRFDHAYANIQTGAYIVFHGGRARLLGRDGDIYIFGNVSAYPHTDPASDVPSAAKTVAQAAVSERRTLTLPVRPGFSLSVFSLTDKSEGVTISGTKYEVEDATLTNAFPIGTSNVWSEADGKGVGAAAFQSEKIRKSAPAVISVQSGILMVVQSRLASGEHI